VFCGGDMVADQCLCVRYGIGFDIGIFWILPGMSDATFWSDILISLALIVLSVLYAMNYPGEAKKKPRKAKRDFKKEWDEIG
jgi:hypothetical protein